MAEENHCPECGAELPADAPQGQGDAAQVIIGLGILGLLLALERLFESDGRGGVIVQLDM